jgi:hypothetical protein
VTGFGTLTAGSFGAHPGFRESVLKMRINYIKVLTALALAFTAAACSTPAAIPTVPRETTAAPSASPTMALVPSPTGTAFAAAAVIPSIQRLSPSSFTKDGTTFSAAAYVRETCLKFEIEITSDQPIPSPSQGADFEPVEDIAFYSGSTGASLVLTLVGRGGGGGTGGGPGAWYQLGREFLYDVKSPLPANGIVALVTFHRSFNISGPAQFDVEPVVRPNLSCPQLPPTTPEG